MTVSAINRLVTEISRTVSAERLNDLPDGELLRRINTGDSAALEAVVRRHGKMVLTAARAVLADSADIDDAFQATFLALWRGGKRIRKGTSLGPWLFGVARRVAKKAQARSQRRTQVESALPRGSAKDDPDPSWREVCRVLYEEIERLPLQYREPIVLCYLEGQSRDEAAGSLGWKEPTLRGRLERGREMLKRRLTRRGVALSAGLIASLTGAEASSGELPSSFVSLAMQAASAAASETPAHITRLLPATNSTASRKLALVAVFALAAGLLSVGLGSDRPRKNAAAAEPAMEGPEAPSDNALPIKVHVLTSDGKPVIDARTWVYPTSTRADLLKEPLPQSTNASGVFYLPLEIEPRQGRKLFVRDRAGRVGFASIGAPWDAETRDVNVMLIDCVERAGRLLGPDGKPIAGAEISPSSYSTDRRGRNPDGPALSIDLPPWERSRLTVKTDSDGSFKLLMPTKDYTVLFRIDSDLVGETKWMASPGVDLVAKLPSPGTVVLNIVGADPAVLKGLGWYLGAPGDGVAGVRLLKGKDGQFDGAGRIVVKNVMPGTYNLRVYGHGLEPVVFEECKAITVVSGQEVEVEAKFGPATTVVGKVISAATGKGIGGIEVRLNIADGSSSNPKQLLYVETDRDGRYVAHGPAGWYSLWLWKLPDGYSLPATESRQLVEPARVEVGKTHEFSLIKLPTAATLRGRVIRSDGKPASGASVILHSELFATGENGRLTADKDGNFAFKNLPPDDAFAPRARLGTAVNIPKTIELGNPSPMVTIEVSEANAASFSGRVVDTKGEPIVGARVSLQHLVQLVGRSARFSTYRQFEDVKTDLKGRYSFEGLWPGDEYFVHVAAEGYATVEGTRLVGRAGQSQEFSVAKLARATLSISGVVTGRNGFPIDGVELFGVDGPVRFATKSAADGRFTLSGFYEGPAFVFAKKIGYRLTASPVNPSTAAPVTILLAKDSEPAAAPPAISPKYQADLDKLTRHILTVIFEHHAQFGYGGNAVADMAHIDLETAKKWRDLEKQRSNGKNDFSHMIDRAVCEKSALDTARRDIDEAVAMLATLPADPRFREAYRLGQQLLPIDKQKAARVAEESVVWARQLQIPAKVWSLAKAGDLAIQSGNLSGGRKVLMEAAELASKLDPANLHHAYAIGQVADLVAPCDFAKAETLLSAIKSGNEYNRALCAVVRRLAATDLSRAMRMLDQFKPDGTSYAQDARLWIAVAVEKPDEAVKLVEGVENGAFRFQGYLRLAMQFGQSNKQRAKEMVEAAFDLLETDPGSLESWSGSGGRAGFAALGVVRAKELGYPDMSSLIARSLMMRPTGQRHWSPKERETALMRFATAIALVDPATARHVLAAVGTPDELVARAISEYRDWLFAVALVYPERAIGLVDQLMSKAQTQRRGGNSLSATGLVELGTILTAEDRLKVLRSYGNLPPELGEDN